MLFAGWFLLGCMLIKIQLHYCVLSHSPAGRGRAKDETTLSVHVVHILSHTFTASFELLNYCQEQQRIA
jgi:hypothetical protein